MLVLKKDYRWGQKPRYYLAEAEEQLMQVPKEVKKCVVFIAVNTSDEIKDCATGFFVGVPLEGYEDKYIPYLVTAKHVIDGIKDFYEEHNIDEEKRKIIIRINDNNGSSETIDTNIDDWKFHHTDTSVDAAVLQMITPPAKFDILTIPREHAITEEKINKDAVGSGDDVLITGLFRFLRVNSKRNHPIMRTGIISLMAEEKIFLNEKYGYAEGYLIEFRSIGGLSGSPAFVWMGAWRSVNNTTTHGAPTGKMFHWLGLVHGHWKTKESKVDFIDLFEEDSMDNDDRNTGIAFVVPANKILEIIDRDDFKKDRERIKSQIDKKNSTVLD